MPVKIWPLSLRKLVRYCKSNWGSEMDVNDRYHALTTNLYPWFEPQWQRVRQLFNEKKLPHALIVNGAKGIGKLHFASSVAQLVLCQDQQPTGACNKCRSCLLFTSSGHPDLYHLAPQDGAAQIKVDQVRDLSSFYAELCAARRLSRRCVRPR